MGRLSHIAMIGAPAVCYLASFVFSLAALRGGERLKALGQRSLQIGLALQTAALFWMLAATFVSGPIPFTGLGAALYLIAWGTLAALLFWQPRYSLFPAPQFLLPLVIALLAASGTVGGEGREAGALAGGGVILLALHAVGLLLAVGVLLAAVAVSLMYLWQQRALNRRPLGRLHRFLPPLESLEKVHFLSLSAGFVLLLAGTASGLMLAHQRWKGIWASDPSVLLTLLTVLWFGVILLVQRSIGLRGRRAAWLTAIGFFILLFTVVGIIFWFPRGKHPFLEKPLDQNVNTSYLMYYIR
jgi:ABC-type uncharacterized transport system permease subunit